MSEEKLRRLLQGMTGGQPASGDRWGALVARRRRRQAWQVGTVGTAGVAVVDVAALTLTGGGSTQTLVATDPTDTPAATVTEGPTQEPSTTATPTTSTAPTSTGGPTEEPTPTASPTRVVAQSDHGKGDPQVVLLGAVGDWSEPAPRSLLSASNRADVPALLRNWVARYDKGDGRSIGLEVEDSQGSAETLHQQVEDLVAKGADGFVATDVDAWTESYLRARGIPVLGGDLSSSLWSSSPVLFAQGTDTTALWDGLAVTAARRTPGGHLGVVCPDGASCDAGPGRLIDEQRAAKYGLDPTVLEKVPASSSDYTSVVLDMRQKGVTVVALAGLAPQQAQGLARTAADVNWSPSWVLSSDLAESSQVLSEPVLRGALSPQQVLPWPAAPAAFRADLPDGAGRNAELTSAWAATQLAEAAVRRMGDSASTPADLRAAADALDGSTLGGVLPPFRPHAVQRCFFVARVGAGRWEAPDGLDTSCGKP